MLKPDRPLCKPALRAIFFWKGTICGRRGDRFLGWGDRFSLEGDRATAFVDNELGSAIVH